ncbi:MAG: SDR family NAD(P)-dependent oxidoreductase [Alphaproteobacteria bacterium]|nr:MAG: SDR family NAD(P)-dependent oxidoreductase [Alphaproteobacteria bacterium]
MLQPKSILITGASSGIGAALAEEYAESGVTLFLGGRNKERLEQVAEQCRSKGATAHISPVDVMDKVTMSSWIGWAHNTAPLDLVIANAGISAGTGGDGESEQQTRSILAVNIEGVINTIYPALDAIRRRRLSPEDQNDKSKLKGQIAIMSSLAGMRGFPGAPAYCASKAAVKSLGESWRGMLMREKIGVTVICPGYVKTPMTDVNNFFMPLLMPASRAAQIIRNGLSKNRPRIAFPFFTYFMTWFLMVMPPRLFDRMLANLPEKPSQ